MTLEINGRHSSKVLEVSRVRTTLLEQPSNLRTVWRHWGMKPVATERFPILVITGVNTDRQGFNTGAGQDRHHNFLL